MYRQESKAGASYIAPALSEGAIVKIKSVFLILKSISAVFMLSFFVLFTSGCGDENSKDAIETDNHSDEIQMADNMMNSASKEKTYELRPSLLNIDEYVAASGESVSFSEVYPLLAEDILLNARLVDLEEGVILKAPKVEITEKDIADELAKYPEEVKESYKHQGLFMSANIATNAIIVADAGFEMSKDDEFNPGILEGFIDQITGSATVTTSEIEIFFKENPTLMGDATLELVKGQIEQYLMMEKQQKLLEAFIADLGNRMPIEISRTWMEKHGADIMDNPVDIARKSGLPSVVNFGGKDLEPTKMMAPVMQTLTEKYEGSLNVVYIEASNHQALSSRFKVQAIPDLHFFDTNGMFVYRHTGILNLEGMEKILKQYDLID